MKSKSWFFVICFLMVSASSCRKEISNCNNATGLEGTWELRKQAGSWSTKDFPAGNGRTITFSGTMYEMRENGQVTRRGEFTVIPDVTVVTSTCLNIPGGQFTNRIVYDNNFEEPKIFIEINDHDFTSISGCIAVDAGDRREYVRL